MQTGKRAVQATFHDATEALAERARPLDPAPEEMRQIDGLDIGPGQWPGAPMDRLPPGCPVVPLGVDGKTSYFVDTLGQLQAISASEWNKKTLTVLFAMTPNYPYWAWPRFAAGKKGGALRINGLETDEAVACLVKAAAERGLFDPMDKVRGRGAWTDSSGGLIWHAGEWLYRVEKGRVTRSRPGDVDGVFYPRRPSVLTPWPSEITEAESPGHDLLEAFRTWSWERPELDPLLMLGWMGASLLGGALPWRPTVFLTGDKGRGKSTLQGIVKQVLGNALHASADTTAAGIYQRVKQDSLPVAVDEIEADDDNRKVIAVIKLARLAASGAEMFRGGAEHEGVQFRARNSFLFSSINTPPLGPQDRSRMAILNLKRVDPARAAAAQLQQPELIGRQMLARLMFQWPDFDRAFADWRTLLRGAGFDGRGQDTYGVLLTIASMLLGDAGMEAAGLPVTEPARVGEIIAAATAAERAEQTDNWRECLDRVLSWTIDNFRGGDRPIVGDVMDQLVNPRPHDNFDADLARKMLAQAGLGLKRLDGCYLLAVPPKGVQVEKIFAGGKFQRGVWMHALRQEETGRVVRKDTHVVKIAGRAERCLLIDVSGLEQEEEG